MLRLAGFENELSQAEAARLSGNEGRARVCARRAAGIVARHYLEKRGITINHRSAYEMLRILYDRAEIPQDVRVVIQNFLMRVDADYHLPSNIDLLADARWLAGQLFPEP